MKEKETGNVAQGANSQEDVIKFLVVLTCPADEKLRNMVTFFKQQKEAYQLVKDTCSDDVKTLYRDMLVTLQGELLGEIQERDFKISLQRDL